MVDLDEKTKNIAKAFSEWLGTREVTQQIDRYNIVKEYINNQEKRLKVMENLFIIPDEVTRHNLLAFFGNVYKEKKIDWKHRPDADTKTRILESFLGGVGCRGKNLNTRINIFFSNISADDPIMDCKQYINFARSTRNNIHSKKSPSNAKHIEEYKIQVISLFVLSLVCLLKNIKHENKPKTGTGGTIFSKKNATEKLKQWFNRNKERFNGIEDKFHETYIKKNLTDDILNVVMNDSDSILKDNLQFLLQKIGKNNNVEMITETDLGKTVPFENFFTIFLFHTVNSLLECKYNGSDCSWEKIFPIFEKLSKHVNKKHDVVLSEIQKGFNNANNIQQGNIIKGEFNTYFFVTLFLIIALKRAIIENSSGVVFYTDNKNVKLQHDDNEKFELEQKTPRFYTIFNNKFKEGRDYFESIEWTLNVEHGDDHANVPISVTCNQWIIVLLHFENGTCQIKKVPNVKYPGLINYEEQWGKFINENEEAKRKAEEEAKRKAEEEAKRKAEEEAKRKAEEEAKRKAEEEAKRKAEEEAKRKAEEEAKRKAEEEAKRKAEEEAKRKEVEKKHQEEIEELKEKLRISQEKNKQLQDKLNNVQQKNDSNIGSYYEGLAIVKDESGNYGYINEAGKLVIPYKWKDAEKFHEGLAKVKDESGNWGFIDKTGELASPCKWKNAWSFSNGLALVQDEAEKYSFIDKTGNVVSNLMFLGSYHEGFATVKDENGNWGFIDKTGKLVISCKWKYAGIFSEGLAMVLDEAGRYGYIDKTGKLVSPCKWKDAGIFSEGIAKVQDENGKWGFIDKTGKLASPCKWKNAWSFNNGLALVLDEAEKYSFIDKTGNVVSNLISIGSYYEGFATVEDENWKYGFIDKTGTLVSPCKWILATNFSEGLAQVMDENWKFGFIDKTGTLVISCKWQYAMKFQEGLAKVKDESDKYGFIDKTGELASPCKWKNAWSFRNGLALVQDEAEKYAFIDKTGNVVSNLISIGSYYEGFATVKDENGKWGFINDTRELVIPCKWKYAGIFREGLATVKDENEMYGFIDKTGKLVSPCKWKDASTFSEGLALVQDENEMYGFIDKTGKLVIPCKWKDAYYFRGGHTRVKDESGRWVSIDKAGNIVI